MDEFLERGDPMGSRGDGIIGTGRDEESYSYDNQFDEREADSEPELCGTDLGGAELSCLKMCRYLKTGKCVGKFLTPFLTPLFDP